MLKTFFQTDLLEAGCDEAGRGCLAGPVFAGAVILPTSFECEELNDSKQVPEDLRYQLREKIQADAIAWAVGVVSHEEIDKMNILRASFLAMHRAIEKLKVQPGVLLIDGNRFNRYGNLPHICVVHGDAIYASIAAASILAKTWRDDYMNELHVQFPNFGWNQNKGYATAQHRAAILEFGRSPFHRKSFRLASGQPEIPF